MKKILYLFSLLFAFSVFANTVEKKSFEEIEASYKNGSDTTYVINFWATWCRPCLEELPDFQQSQTDFKGQKVKFIFISLDNPESEARVIGFVNKKGYEGAFYLLSDSDPNSWINKINIDWEGNIPATLIVNAATKTEVFHSGKYNHEELNTLITESLKQ